MLDIALEPLTHGEQRLVGVVLDVNQAPARRHARFHRLQGWGVIPVVFIFVEEILDVLRIGFHNGLLVVDRRRKAPEEHHALEATHTASRQGEPCGEISEGDFLRHVVYLYLVIRLVNNFFFYASVASFRDTIPP